MNGRRVDPARSRILLVGTPSYADPELPDVPVITQNITDLKSVFTDPALGGFDPAHCIAAPPDASSTEIGKLLIMSAAQAEDLLLFYYCGHGLVGSRDRQLYLSLRDTLHDQEGFSAISFAAVRGAFLKSKAAKRVVILDSCFSGRAIETLAAGDAEIMGQVEVAGSYTLTSAPSNRTALVLPGERHTAFTERFLDLLRSGRPGAGEMLTLRDVYEHMSARLNAEALPPPQQSNTGTADGLGLVKNRAFSPSAPTALSPEVVSKKGTRHDPVPPPQPSERSIQLLRHAERVAGQIGEPGDQALVLTSVAGEMAVADPVHSQELLRRAADAARRSTDPIRKARALAAMGALERTLDREQSSRQFLEEALEVARRAEPHLAVSVFRRERAGNYRQTAAGALWAIAMAFARADPDRAQAIAQSIKSGWGRGKALAAVAVRIAAVSPERAVAVALNSGEPTESVVALRRISSLLAPGDPERAEELLGSISSDDERDRARHAVAVAFARRDPDRAVQVAESISTAKMRWEALARIAGTVAAKSPDRAERIAGKISEQDAWAVGLAGVAAAVARTDPDRAKEMFAKVEHSAKSMPGEKNSEKAARVAALCSIAVTLASVDPDGSQRLAVEAEKTARLMKDGSNKYSSASQKYSLALIAVGAAFATTDIDRGKKVIAEGKDASGRYYNSEPAEKLSAAIRAVAPSDPDRAELMALRLLSDRYQVSMLTEIAMGQAVEFPDRAERIASKIQYPVRQAAALIEIALIQASGEPSFLPKIDTEMPPALWRPAAYGGPTR